mgnify:CR=1
MVKYRIKVTFLDADGRVHGPCRNCGFDVTVEPVQKPEMRPGVVIRRRHA